MKLNLGIFLGTLFLSSSILAQTSSDITTSTSTTSSPTATTPAPATATTTTTTTTPGAMTAPATTTVTQPTANTLQQQSTVTTSSTTTSAAPQTATTIMTTTNPAEDNKRAGDAFLTNNKMQQGVMSLPSGLQYRIISKGNGPRPTKNDVVTVNYEGKHLNGQVFDSSYQRGQPATFPVDAVILGWQEALQLMNVGDTWELFIPGDLAYGARGVPGAIAPNETLVFKVNLISAKPKTLQ